MSYVKQTGVRHMVSAVSFSLAGLRAAWSEQAAFRQECALAALLMPLAFWLGQSSIERALLIGSCMLVLIVELLNSAIEAAVDRVGLDHHQLAAQAKDLGSAAVFLSLMSAATVWLLIGWGRLS
jgi:diacylglycerol kinase (ATP)